MAEFSKFEILKEVEILLRSRDVANLLVNCIKKLCEKISEDVRIMSFCGTHEWSVTNYGLRSLLPKKIEIIAGPGCPVCVTPSYYIEELIKLSMDGVQIYTYGDVFRLPAVKLVRGAKSLEDAKALGGEVRVVTGLVDAIELAKNCKDSIFVGIGFETVAPGYAHAILKDLIPKNLKILSLLKLTPPAMYFTVEKIDKDEKPLSGIIAPGHVSTIVGAKAWKKVAEDFRIPIVVAGFEPVDILMAIAKILQQIISGEAKVELEYTRAVSYDGDLRAQKLLSSIFEAKEDAWRGIGFIPGSGLRINEGYRRYDAFEYFNIEELRKSEWNYDLNAGCRCSDIVLGRAKPTDCKLFMRVCNPENPYGPCMVSVEGTCSIWARFGAKEFTDDILEELKLR
ncbi:MAG: hydrogenase formation protein HypD [Archaeoglobales archaeon]|nr:hydrogenase formation protein HypD [Archaeoglobales archaeon]